MKLIFSRKEYLKSKANNTLKSTAFTSRTLIEVWALKKLVGEPEYVAEHQAGKYKVVFVSKKLNFPDGIRSPYLKPHKLLPEFILNEPCIVEIIANIPEPYATTNATHANLAYIFETFPNIYGIGMFGHFPKKDAPTFTVDVVHPDDPQKSKVDLPHVTIDLSKHLIL